MAPTVKQVGTHSNALDHTSSYDNYLQGIRAFAFAEELEEPALPAEFENSQHPVQGYTPSRSRYLSMSSNEFEPTQLE
jgi:hypothetical protein